MRLWLRLTLLLVTLTLVPLLITGGLAVRTASENATLRPEEAMSRDASTLATFVGSWVDGQARMLAGWQRVWDVREKSDDYRLGLVRATYQAMDAAVTVVLIDQAGRAVVPAQYLQGVNLPPGREAGSDARTAALLGHLPARLGAEGIAIGDPYMPPGGTVPAVPIVVGLGGDAFRMVAEVSMAPVTKVFEVHADRAAVLVDGYGKPVLGGDHPFLQDADLNALLDLGLDLTFSDDADPAGRLQGAIWSVPYTQWKTVVLAAPGLAAAAAATIRNQTLKIAGLALVVVLLTGLTIERTLTRSVKALGDHAQEVTRGAYGTRNLVDRGDELGELGLALNVMATELEISSAEIRAFHAELQQRVDARTAELKAAQAQLVKTGQLAAVAEMGAGLAHELNNPLAAILGQIQLLRSQGTGDDGRLAAMEQQAARCREVVDTMVRLASGEVASSSGERVPLQRLLDVAMTQVQGAFDARGVVLDAVPDTEGIQVRIDPALGRRVLAQLLEALCAGLPRGGVVQVAITRTDVPEVQLVPDRDIAHGDRNDHWKAAGMRAWTARGLLDLAGGEVLAPDAHDGVWRARFPADV